MTTEAIIGAPTSGIVAAVGVLNTAPTITGAVATSAVSTSGPALAVGAANTSNPVAIIDPSYYAPISTLPPTPGPSPSPFPLPLQIISGTESFSITDIDKVQPFSSVVIGDVGKLPVSGGPIAIAIPPDVKTVQGPMTIPGTETVTVTLSNAANGQLSNLGTGKYDSHMGVYTVWGSPSVVTAALDALTFIPTAYQVERGSAVTTSFSISVNDDFGRSVSGSGGNVSVTSTSNNVLATISGTKVSSQISDKQTVQPFSTVVIADPDIIQTETLNVTLSNSSHGSLSSPLGGSYDPIIGTFTCSGSIAFLNSVLNSLVFIPSESSLWHDFNYRLLATYSDQTKFGFYLNGVDESHGTLILDAPDSYYFTGINKSSLFSLLKSGAGYSSSLVPLGNYKLDGEVEQDQAGNLYYWSDNGTLDSPVYILNEIMKTDGGYNSVPTVLATLSLDSSGSWPSNLLIDKYGDIFFDIETDTSVIEYELSKNSSGFLDPLKEINSLTNYFSNVYKGYREDSNGNIFFAHVNTAYVSNDSEAQGYFAKASDVKLYEIPRNSDGSYGAAIDIGAGLTIPFNSSLPFIELDSNGNIFVMLSSYDHGQLTDSIYEFVKTTGGYAPSPISVGVNKYYSQNSYGSYVGGNMCIDANGNVFELMGNPSGGLGPGSIIEFARSGAGFNSSPVTVANLSGPVNADLYIDTDGNMFGVTKDTSKGPYRVYELSPVVKATTATTSFLISVSDGVATTSDSITSVITTATSSANYAPTITGAVASQAITDQSTKTPFAGITIADSDIGQYETVTVTLSNPLNGRLSNLGTGTYSSVTGVYSVTGSTSAVTAAVDALVFTPTANQVTPGSSVTTTFTVGVNDGVAPTVTNNTTTIVATSVNDTPTVSGTKSGISITDKQTIQPFSSVIISDQDLGQTDTLTVTLSNSSYGALSSTLGGSYDPVAGTFTFSGANAQLNNVLDSLVFTPSASSGWLGFKYSQLATFNDTAALHFFFDDIRGVDGSLIFDAYFSTGQSFSNSILSLSQEGSSYSAGLQTIANVQTGLRSDIVAGPSGNLYYFQGSGTTSEPSITLHELVKKSVGYQDSTLNVVAGKDHARIEVDDYGDVFYQAYAPFSFDPLTPSSLNVLAKSSSGYSSTSTVIVPSSSNYKEIIGADADGNLFYVLSDTDNQQNARVFEVLRNANGTYGSAIDLNLNLNLSDTYSYFYNMDCEGNIFVEAVSQTLNASLISIFEFPLASGIYSRLPTNVSTFSTSGLVLDGGFHLDSIGNIFIPVLGDPTQGQSGAILEIQKIATGYSPLPMTIYSSGLDFADPLDFHLDSKGNLFGVNFGPTRGSYVVFELTPLVNSTTTTTNFSISVSDGLVSITDNTTSVITTASSSVNHAPTITSAATATTPEDIATSTAVYTVTATDPDANTTLTYSISPGGDASLFNINSSTGAVTFKASPDFEAPVDADKNNVYNINVRVSDGSLPADKVVAITVTDLPDSSVANLHGIDFFWKANASGQHALLSGVNVSATGGTQPVEGANAPIQFKNVIWDATGHATVDVYAHVTTAVDSVQINLGLGSATNATFSSALTSDWTLLGNPSGGEYVIGGYSVTPLVTGDIKLGTLAFDTGSAAQMHLAVDAGSSLGSSTVTGSQGTIMATPYGMTLGHSTSGADGAYTISPLDPGTYALTASRSTSDIGNAITSADALAALKIAVGLNPNPGSGSSQSPVSPFQIIAADVNADGRVTSADALGILKIAVHMTTAATPQWMFVDETRDLSGLSRTNANWDHNIIASLQGDTTENLVGMIKGDVNGSWTPPTGTQYVETTDPNHFTYLYNTLHIPLSEWGVL